MAEPDDPELPSTKSYSDWDDFAPIPWPRSEPAVDGILGACGPQKGGGWQPPTPEELQTRLPHYEVTKLLGRGGMGAVYQGWQRSLNRFVAIKILPPALDGNGADFAERFKREAKAMARLKHPGIIPVHDAGETTDGLLYFVMDYVEGIDLQKLVAAEGRLAPQKALTIATQILDALAYAHEHGIIHRDIKPANIMVDPDGRVHVADFGLARSTGADLSTLTGSHVTMGTPDFMAPESRLGMSQADHRADLYAVGVMLYRMLTGKLPHGRFDSPSRAVPGLDRRLDRIVDRALQSDPDARYSSARELRLDLDPVLGRARSRRVPAANGATTRGRAGLWIGLAAVAVTASAALYFGKAKPPSAGTSSIAPSKPISAPVLEPDAIRLWDEPEKIPVRQGVRWENGAVRLDDTVLTSAGPADSRDVLLQAWARMNPDAVSPQIAVRVGGNQQEGKNREYSLGVLRSASRFDLAAFIGKERRVLASWPFPRHYCAP